MRTYRHEPLWKHTSLRIGGPARRFVVPESRAELLEAVRECRRTRTPWAILGRGSNVLASDRGVERVVIKNTEACRELRALPGGVIEAGASVPLQEFIHACVANGLVGMEYLYSVPGNIGGGLFMNAGRRPAHRVAISDHLEAVEVFDGEEIVWLPKADGRFAYRTSVFQRRPGWVILGARFRLPPQPTEVGRAKIAERMAYVRRDQDPRYPNAGSVFKRGFPLAKAWMGRRVRGAMFSDRTPNWISNIDHATCRDVLRLVAAARWDHLLRGRRWPELEWVVWS